MKAPIEMNIINYDTRLPVEMDRFWASSGNKLKLQMLLHEHTIKCRMEQPSKLQVIVSGFSGDSVDVACQLAQDGCSAKITELCQNIEEADARIIPHAMHAVKNGARRIIVLSSDTDVFVLLMHYWNVLHSNGLSEMWLRASVGDSTRYIPIHTLASRVKEKLCHVLPLLHTLTGCDYTSKVGTKHAALNNVDPTEFFSNFDYTTGCSEAIVASCEGYLIQVIKKNSSCRTMDRLRDYMYHHSKCIALEQLPPTSHAIHQHILRAYYSAYNMMTLLAPHKPTKLDPTLFGFEEADEILTPVKAVRSIPEEYTVICKCKKCGSIRCACHKKGLPCISFCACQSIQSLEEAACD